MKIVGAVVSKSTQDPLLEEGVKYLKRLHHPFAGEALFIAPKTSIKDAKLRIEQEGREILQKTQNFYRIVLVEEGKSFSSNQFAKNLEKLMHISSKIVFIVGGAYGLSPNVVENSQQQISLSAMTLPHRLAFLLIAEQIYRAQEIIKDTPYHK
jgi:23S rRNA (pseudouridine1915-N3)-methyltransferase